MKKLLFVYNATLNPVSLVKDFINEILPQREGNCKLCDITYSLVFQKKAWKDFIETLNVESEFLLKDQFLKKYSSFTKTEFPCIIIEENKKPIVLIEANEINRTEDLNALINLVSSKLEKFK